jgi:chromosomal replication initiation ATPase DnaA
MAAFQHARIPCKKISSARNGSVSETSRRTNGRLDQADGVIEAICAKYGVSRPILLSMRRNRSLIDARRECAVELRKLNMSLPEIGRAMNRDLTTILHHFAAHGRVRHARTKYELNFHKVYYHIEVNALLTMR